MTLELPGDEGIVDHDVALGPLTTYRCGGAARFYAEVPDIDTLLRLLVARRAAGDLPLLVLGSPAGRDMVLDFLVSQEVQAAFGDGRVYV